MLVPVPPDVLMLLAPTPPPVEPVDEPFAVPGALEVVAHVIQVWQFESYNEQLVIVGEHALHVEQSEEYCEQFAI